MVYTALSKIHYFIGFLAPFLLEAVEERGVTFNQTEGSRVKWQLHTLNYLQSSAVYKKLIIFIFQVKYLKN